MRQQRKEDLLYRFPSVPENIKMQMDGKGAANFCVFLTRGAELFVRCYHRYFDGFIAERQRYVFAKDGCVRYILDHHSTNMWKIATKFTEPRFILPGLYAHYHSNTYCILNAQAQKRSDMRYCPLSEYTRFPLQFLRLYVRHPNIEYLVKAGYSHLINAEEYYYYQSTERVSVSPLVDFKSNNLLKMLHLNRSEFKSLRGRETLYERYVIFRDAFPKYRFDDLIEMSAAYGNQLDALQLHYDWTGLSPVRLSRYLNQKNISPGFYSDYLDQCRTLGYDLHDTSISLPRDFYTMHDRLSALIKVQHDELMIKAFKRNQAERLCYEYSADSLILRLPNSLDEIATEGKVLGHCVGGYAERHAKGQTTILFLRKADEPDKPYYTMEINDKGKIIQCYGYKNNRAGNPKPPEIKAFEQQYERYLQEVIHGKRNKHAVRQSA